MLQKLKNLQKSSNLVKQIAVKNRKSDNKLLKQTANFTSRLRPRKILPGEASVSMSLPSSYRMTRAKQIKLIAFMSFVNLYVFARIHLRIKLEDAITKLFENDEVEALLGERPKTLSLKHRVAEADKGKVHLWVTGKLKTESGEFVDIEMEVVVVSLKMKTELVYAVLKRDNEHIYEFDKRKLQ
ncbi:hypothetical protein MHBO_001516 [Bonamia ostreae]|uniref:Uncharacterized protein n=1 Tax=Bonamia ostreae TaxID=126728 RepID=A0ABV2AJ91_9EUKA